MADVFISYARNDKARVAPLVAAIEAQGWSVWWDPGIDPGQEFDRQIAAELKAAAAVLVVWSRNSVESRWVRGEAREGADRGILVPIRFDGASLPIDVRALHTTDFDDWREDRNSPQAQEVLRALAAVIGRGRARGSAGHGQQPQAPAAADGPARLTICVLPFANLGGDPEQQYFSDGISEDIITELSRWRILSVRSRSASFRYRGVALDMQQVARELHVRYIVEGSIRRMGERIRINAQLIDTETGSHIWAEKFDRSVAELFAVQDHLVQTIVSTLVGRVQASDTERLRRKPPASLDAYECVLKGNALPWDDAEGAAEAMRLFEKAIELDPGYGIAYALLSALWCGKWRGEATDSDAALQKAYTLANRAIELDQNDSTCFSMLSSVLMLRRSYDLALQHMRRAVEINPNNQWNVADMACTLVNVGQPEEALKWFTRAREIDPFFDQPWYWRGVGLAYMTLHRYQEALDAFTRVPIRNYQVAAYTAGCHARLGDADRARACTAECLALKPAFSVGQFMAKRPFRNPEDASNLAESLRMAGLPA
jgi:adenylate cyclase